MKTASAILCVLCISAFNSAFGITPFVGQFKNADGSAMTNPFTMQAWPQTFTWTVNGTNIIYGGILITNVPNSSGFFTNSFYANGFRLFVPAYNSYLFGYLPDTTQVVNLALCLSNAPATAQGLSQYGLITNWLGYAPVPPTWAGVTNALGYAPPTNTYANFTNILGWTPTYAGITNLIGIPATNGGPLAYSQLPFTPPSNNYVGISNAVGFVFATNGGPLAYSQLPYIPPTNTYAGISNVLGFNLATNNPQTLIFTNFTILTFTTNSSGGVTNFTFTNLIDTLIYTHP
ncbi:MAG TPA: hypothetical protein VK742_20480 [Candidatus Sulfotelmatobacter sp.]|jgi:hypothetical protein|nr:hypothetical protein [Candidatus Sulfotelmatobacter sp.]